VERSELRLRSAVFGDTWHPGKAVAASCRHAHAAPAPGCTCGIYAVQTPAAALRYLVGRDDADVVHRVLGEVALWGVVVECEHGWRAQHAYPLRLCVPSTRPDGTGCAAADVAHALTAYGVDVTVLDRQEIASYAPATLVP
jgi:hypothetical protein